MPVVFTASSASFGLHRQNKTNQTKKLNILEATSLSVLNYHKATMKKHRRF